jgi:hypothetical protein
VDKAERAKTVAVAALIGMALLAGLVLVVAGFSY